MTGRNINSMKKEKNRNRMRKMKRNKKPGKKKIDLKKKNGEETKGKRK